jgi:hypothetical protein
MDAQAFLVELRVLIGGPLIECKQVRVYTCVSYKLCEDLSLANVFSSSSQQVMGSLEPQLLNRRPA